MNPMAQVPAPFVHGGGWNPTPKPHMIPKVGRVPGLPVKMNGDHWRALHVTYVWLQSKGQTTPEIDDLMAVIPSFEAGEAQGWKMQTFRIRAKDVHALAVMLEEASKLHFKGDFALRKRAKALRMIDPNDLLADAAR